MHVNKLNVKKYALPALTTDLLFHINLNEKIEEKLQV